MNRIQYKKIKNGKYKYEVTETYVVRTLIRPDKNIEEKYFTLTTDGWLMLKIGYRWNGDDIVFDCKSSMEASAEHDAFCQCVKLGFLDIGWSYLMNERYKETCVKNGMNKILASIRRFGLKAYWGFKRWIKGLPKL